MKNNSLALELIQDYKKQNKRQFIIILVLLAMLFLATGYLVYILNDIGTIETTQEVDNIDTINGNVVNNGDING